MRELEAVVTELLDAYLQLGEDRATEHRARGETWIGLPQDWSVAARDREVDMNTYDLHAITILTEHRVRALEAERDYLMWVGDHADRR